MDGSRVVCVSMMGTYSRLFQISEEFICNKFNMVLGRRVRFYSHGM